MPKCKYCGKEIRVKDAYIIKGAKRNSYFCNYEHSIAISVKTKANTLANEILGGTTSTMFYKEMLELNKVHSWEKIAVYLEDNKDYISSCMNKEFNSEYAKIRYFFAILKNNIGNYKMQKKEYKKDFDFDFVNNKKKKCKTKNGLEEVLKGLL